MIRRMIIGSIAGLFFCLAAYDLADRNWRIGVASGLLGVVNYLLIS